MRIACLQFAPQVGEVEANVRRAEAILEEGESLEDLDVLVLPEMALSGYNFTSLEHISPFLEHCGSGTSATWAHAVAKKHDCLVAIGYPETVDIADKWPADPEYYNSAAIVNKHGDILSNYRKAFLYYTDETWALEGDDGFFEGYIPELGNAAYGICMDLNPYKFENPWTEYEFGNHIVQSESNVVIVSMAWMTREDAGSFLRTPKHPDLDTLTYWVSRLEPVLRVEGREEVIVIFCNRCGTEDEVVYAGTSAVVGIRDGEVRVYGVLGRGEEKLLVVDTSKPPQARLVAQPAPTANTDQNGDVHDAGRDDESSSSPGQGSSSSDMEGTGKGSGDHSTGPSHQNVAKNSMASHRKGKLSDLHKLSTGFGTQTVRPESLELPTPMAPSPTPMHMRPQVGAPQSAQSQVLNVRSPDDDSSHMSLSHLSTSSAAADWTDIRPQDSISHIAPAFDDDSASAPASQPSLRALKRMTSPRTQSQTSSGRDDLLIDFENSDELFNEPGSETVSAVYRHGLSELHSPPPDYSAVVGASFRVPRLIKGLQSYKQRPPSRVGTETPPLRLKTFGSMSDLRQESVISAPATQGSHHQNTKRSRRTESITIRQREGTPIQLPARPQSVNTGRDEPSMTSHETSSMVPTNQKKYTKEERNVLPAKRSPPVAQTTEPQPSPRGSGIVNRASSRTAAQPSQPSDTGGNFDTPDPSLRSRRRLARHRSGTDSFPWSATDAEGLKSQMQRPESSSRYNPQRDPRQSSNNTPDVNRNQTVTPNTFATLSLLNKKRSEDERRTGQEIPAHWLDALEGTGLSQEAKARAEREAIACLHDMQRLKKSTTTMSRASNSSSKHPRSRRADGLSKIEIHSVDTISPESPTTPGSALKTPKAMVLFSEIDEALSNAVISQQDKRTSVIRYPGGLSLDVTS